MYGQAGGRRVAAQAAHHLAVRVGLDALQAGSAAQQVFVLRLQAGAAEIFQTAVRARLDAPQIVGGDAPDIADEMRGHAGVRVVPLQARLQFQARHAVLVHGDARGLQFVQIGAQGLPLKRRPPRQQRAKTPHRFRFQFNQLPDLVQQLVDVVDLVRQDFEVVDAAVLGHDAAVAVVNQAAHRRNRHEVDAVVLRQGGKPLVRGDLQIRQPRHQHRRQQQHAAAGQRQPPAHDAAVAHLVADRNHARTKPLRWRNLRITVYATGHSSAVTTALCQ